MGVAGCGKSTVAGLLASLLGVVHIEGDDFHPVENLSKMKAGIALTDADRKGWLDTLGRELSAQAGGAVLSCSALKRDYRDRLRAAVPGLHFVFLDLNAAEAHQRVAARSGTHLFPPSLVESQFATLERPGDEPRVLQLNALLTPQNLASAAAVWLARDNTDETPERRHA
jgi:gluconokinase